MRLVIDPGHSLIGDKGATAYDSRPEHIFNLAVSNRVRALLENYFTVYMTRTWEMKTIETTLKARTDLAWTYNADLLLSIHHNAVVSQTVKGTEVFFKPGCAKSEHIARTMYDNIFRCCRAAGYEYIGRGIKPKPFYVLRNSPCPAVLVECGFITNQEDFLWCSSPIGQITLGYAISKTVLEIIK